MAKQKVWNLKYVAGNPELFSKVTSASSNPMKRSESLEAAQVVSAHGWRAWVEHAETEKRIFESTQEQNYQEERAS